MIQHLKTNAVLFFVCFVFFFCGKYVKGSVYGSLTVFQGVWWRRIPRQQECASGSVHSMAVNKKTAKGPRDEIDFREPSIHIAVHNILSLQPGNKMPSNDPEGHQAYTRYTCLQVFKITQVYKIKNCLKSNKIK